MITVRNPTNSVGNYFSPYIMLESPERNYPPPPPASASTPKRFKRSALASPSREALATPSRDNVEALIIRIGFWGYIIL